MLCTSFCDEQSKLDWEQLDLLYSHIAPVVKAADKTVVDKKQIIDKWA